jgi:hypothetical protein
LLPTGEAGMILFMWVFLIISLSFLGLSLGWLILNKPIKGTCGGLNQLNSQGSCQVCGKKSPSDCVL